MTLASNAILPVVYWYGHADSKRNPLLMDRLIRNLGVNVQEKFDQNPEGLSILGHPVCTMIDGPSGQTAGIIVDTPSSFASGSGINDHRQKLIRACIDAFKS